jgi:pyocin large subunit-like protein
MSSPLRPVRADTPGNPATPESPSILCASTAECTEKRHLTESSIFECFPEFLRRAQNAKQYVEEAVEFVTHPPAGTLSKLRANGDTVLYNAETNTFAVKTAAGAPRTMFKPSGNGMAYFNAQ